MRIFLAILCLSLFACTVVPRQVRSPVASFDGNAQNSGTIGMNLDGTISITAHARDRYNALIAIYGQEFKPTLAADAGIKTTGDAISIDREHYVDFETMNRWRKAGYKPSP